MKLITLFICYEYKAIIKQLIITSYHFLIVTFSKKQIVIEHQWNSRPTPLIEDRDSTRITLQSSYFPQFSSAHSHYIPQIFGILGAITMDFFQIFQRRLFFKKSICLKKTFFLIIKFGVKIVPKNTTTSAI